MTYEEVLAAFGTVLEQPKNQPANIPLINDFILNAGAGIHHLDLVTDEGLLRGALLSIPSNEYKVWIDVGLALKNAAEKGELREDDAYEFWRAWSETDASYDEGMCERKWEGMSPQGGISLGSVFFKARDYGWNGRRMMTWGDPDSGIEMFKLMNGIL